MKTVCFGEIMLRLNPEGYKRIRQADTFNVSYAGGEANVAVALANFGVTLLSYRKFRITKSAGVRPERLQDMV